MLNSGFTDSYRHLYPNQTDAYTFWTYRGGCRAKNVGWRLDYFILSERLEDLLVDNIIDTELVASDHAPITLLMNIDI